MGPAANVCIRIALPGEREGLESMFHRYVQELLAFGADPDAIGPLSPHWWDAPKDLFPHMILAQGEIVGFVLVMGQRAAEKMEVHTEFLLNDLFVLPRFRGQGLAKQAVMQLLERDPGLWGLQVLEGNAPALAFWQSVLREFQPERQRDPSQEGVWLFSFRTS